MRGFGVALLVLGSLVAGTAYPRLATAAGGRRETELLYLPNGRYLRVLSLGNAALVADVVYLWSIQFYADYERSDRFRYVEHVFGDVITELDPHYLDAYWLGAMILSVEASDLDAALRLLEKGFRENPRAWILPYLAGWECHRFGRFARAADYFRRAADVPGAPPMVLRMRAGMTARAGSLREALAQWREVLEDSRSDDTSRRIAARQVRDLQVRIDLSELQAAVRDFAGRLGKLPARLEDLSRSGVIRSLPADPDGEPYGYDPSTGRVSSGASRVLGDR